GPPIEDPAEAIGRYREHRRQRVAQVREAIARTGTRDPDALVELVYGDALHPALRSAATGSVRAIIQYLAAHGESERLRLMTDCPPVRGLLLRCLRHQGARMMAGPRGER